MNRAFIFPGQGSQVVGMGKDFYNKFQTARTTFQFIDDSLNYKLSNIIFNGSDEELTLTQNTQPALMAVSMAIINTLKDQNRTNIASLCQYVAGHSLGEYSALCAAESISLIDTAKLLRRRGEAMQNACAFGVGAMAACIGIDITALEQIIYDYAGAEVCQIANDNISGQIVISGHNASVERVIAILKDLGYKAIKLKVSAPFHCDLMQPAEQEMTQALSEVIVDKPIVPVITNVTAVPTNDPMIIKQNLITQVCGRVRWRETIDQLVQAGIEEIVEIGSGKILTGMIKRTNHKLRTVNIGTVTEFDEFMESNLV
ncbi:ACP S-malonyltransferase [Candidatus Trichorickettsia mobilis]|nr:ACP S-malonyltransferase [Candidatus Trichorickettsia mobilis]